MEVSSGHIEFGSDCQGAFGAADDVHPLFLEDRHQKFGQFLVGLHAEILPVVPFGFFRVELGACFLDLVEGEGFYEFVHGEHLPVVSGVPSKHGKHVHEGLGEITVLTVTVGDFSFRIDPLEREDRESHLVPVPFAQLPVADRLQEQREMGKAGHGVLPAKCLVEHVMEGQGREPFLTADYFGDFHQMIVHDVGKMVGRQFVSSFPKHLVVQGVRVDFNMATDEIIHLHHCVTWHLEAYGPVDSLLQKPVNLFLGKGEGIAHLPPGHLVVGKGFLGCLCFGTSLFQLF